MYVCLCLCVYVLCIMGVCMSVHIHAAQTHLQGTYKLIDDSSSHLSEPHSTTPQPPNAFPLPSPPAARPPPDWRFISRRQTSGVPPTLQAISVDKVIIEMLWPGASDIAR